MSEQPQQPHPPQSTQPAALPPDLLWRLYQEERARNELLLSQHVTKVTHMETRLTAVEGRMQDVYSPSQWVKALAGLLLPLAALWLTGSVDAARTLLQMP